MLDDFSAVIETHQALISADGPLVLGNGRTSPGGHLGGEEIDTRSWNHRTEARSVNKTSVISGAVFAALFAGIAYKYMEDAKSARALRTEFIPYTAPLAGDNRPYYQQSRPTAHVEATAETTSNGVIAGASFFANDYCPDLSYTGSLSRLRWHVNADAEDKEYSRLVTAIHAAPHSIDAMCTALLAKYSNYLYVSRVSHKWENNNLRDPHMFGKQNDWKTGRYSGRAEGKP